jgi:hypothetical protein
VTYALVFDIPGPPELYHALHAEFSKYPTDGLLVHVARPTAQGIQVTEVWVSEEAQRSWMAANAGPAVGAVAAAGWTLPELVPVPFDPAGLLVPTAGIAI